MQPGVTAEYRVDFDAETFACLKVTSEPVQGVMGEVTVRVLAPGDHREAEFAGVLEDLAGHVAWVGEPGGHRVEIENSAGIPVAFRLDVEELRVTTPGDRDRAAAITARAEADRLAGGGDRERVLAALERSFESWMRAGEHDAAVGVLLDGVAFESFTNPQAALVRCDEVLELSLQAGLPVRQIEALNWTGTILLLTQKDCQGAFRAYDRAREIAHFAGLTKWVAEVAFSIGALERRCALDRAPAAFEEAIAAARRAGHTSLEAQSYLELAIMAKHRGDLSGARDHIERAWRLAQESGDPQVEADVSHERGNLNRRQGRLAEALESFRLSLDLNVDLDRNRQVLDALLSLGALALELRRPEEALEYSSRALRVAETRGDRGRQSLAQVQLGAVHHRQGDYVRAEEAFRLALETAEGLEAGQERMQRIAAARFRLGSALLAQDRPEPAITELEAAGEAQDSIADRIGKVQTLLVLGTVLGRLGERDEARESLSAALAMNEKLGDPLRTVAILYRLAEVESFEDPVRALATIEEAIAIGQRVRASLELEPLRAGFSEAPRRLYELYVDLLVRAGDPQGAFAANEEGRARALLDLLTEARIDLAAGVAPRLRDELQDLEGRIAWLRQRLGQSSAGMREEQRAALRAEIERAEQEWWRAEAAIREQSPRYSEMRAPPIVSVAEVQASLPPGRVLLEYWLGQESSYVFAVASDSFDLVRLPPVEKIESEVAALRSSIVKRLPPTQYAERAHRLYRELVAPALSAARSGAQPIDELVIVPDGPLHLLPFEALVVTEPNPESGFGDLTYLLRGASVNYAPSASVLSDLERRRLERASLDRQDRTRPELTLLAFGDPRYERALDFDCPPMTGSADRDASATEAVRSRRLDRLAGSGSEVQAIAAPYGRRARVHVGSEASEERIKTDPDLATAERLHFAVHGVICESLPERSGLVFALDDQEQDGILETREIFGLELSADLVVLSACETGLGKLVSGEGVVGLVRAFFYAGTPSLVVSLWQVSDRSSQRLMTSFYGHLDRGLDKASALRRAQLEMVEAGGKTAAPFYWAPFVLLGSRDVRAESAPVVTPAPP